MNLRVLKTPARVPQGNAFCERVIGTVRRECLEQFILLDERHLWRILAEWVPHYSQGRPHASLGPSIPEPSARTVARTAGHELPPDTASLRGHSRRSPSRVSTRIGGGVIFCGAQPQ